MHFRNIDRFTMRKSETKKLKTQAKEDVQKMDKGNVKVTECDRMNNFGFNLAMAYV